MMHWQNPERRVFSSPRVIACPVNQQDANFIASLYQSAKVMQYIGTPMSKQQAMDIAERCIRHTQESSYADCYWRLAHRDSKVALGILGLCAEREHPSTAQLGIMLTPSAFQQRLATETISAMLSVGFDVLKFSQINAQFNVKNIAVPAIAQRLGFTLGRAVEEQAGELWGNCTLTRTRWLNSDCNQASFNQ